MSESPVPITEQDKPLVILQPAPQRADRVFGTSARTELAAAFRVIDLEGETDPAAFDAALPDAFAIIGQADLPAQRLARADRLRAICSVRPS